MPPADVRVGVVPYEAVTSCAFSGVSFAAGDIAVLAFPETAGLKNAIISLLPEVTRMVRMLSRLLLITLRVQVASSPLKNSGLCLR